MPRCLLCSTNEEVKLNKWKNNYVCLKLHLLCTPESWHAFQWPATERRMGKSTRLHYSVIALKNTSPDWSESCWDLPEWIWITHSNFLLSPGWHWDLLSQWAQEAPLLFRGFPETLGCWRTLYWREVHLVVLAHHPANGCTGLPQGTPSPVPQGCSSHGPCLHLCFFLITQRNRSGWFLRPFWQQQKVQHMTQFLQKINGL